MSAPLLVPRPIEVRDLFSSDRHALIELLRGLKQDEWSHPFRALRDVITRVVEERVGRERPHDLDVPRARDGSDFATKRLRDLHRERPDATTRPVDENTLAALTLP